MFTRVALLLLLLAMGGCTLTPSPDAPELVTRITSLPSFDSGSSEASVAPDPAGWWRQIGGDELETLVTVLLDGSLVLSEARLQREQAAERAVQAGAQRRPSVGYAADRQRLRNPDPTGSYSWADSHSAGFTLNYELDVFGALRNSVRAAALSAEAAALSYEATEQLEIARLSRQWVAAVTLQERLALARATAASFRSTLELTEQRYRLGSQGVSASDVLIARQNLESARVDIPDLEGQLRSQLLLIDEQLARIPGTTAREFTGIAGTPTATMAVGYPAALMAQRPDVAAAALRYRAALEDIGAARANLYPALSLTGALTFQGERPGDFSWDNYLSSLTQSITGPVFQGGRLRAQVRLERAEAEELAASFARAALAALTDVEIALTERDARLTQQALAQAAVQTATQSNRVVSTRYRQGLSSLLAVLETQRSLNSAQLNLILTEQALRNASIDLYLSLGGDWFPTGAAR
ncbi:MAG: efflux transporter outer membrane subunit [Pseudomonadota bacterium]